MRIWGIEIRDLAPNVPRDQIEQFLCLRRETPNGQIISQHENGNINAAQEIIQRRRSRRSAAIAVVQFLVQRRQFLVARLQLLFGRFHLFIGALQFLVARLDFFVGGFEFFIGRLLLLDDSLQRFLGGLKFCPQASGLGLELLRAARVCLSPVAGWVGVLAGSQGRIVENNQKEALVPGAGFEKESRRNPLRAFGAVHGK